MARTFKPRIPTARDLEILAVLQERDGALTEVELRDGRTYRVWNIAWGYDEGEAWAHVTTNVSPDVPGEAIDIFTTEDVATIRVASGGERLLGPDSPSA